MLTRRNFLLYFVGGSVSLSTSWTVFAKTNTSGFIELSNPAPEGIYNFFSYACGHCYRFHPQVESLRVELKSKGLSIKDVPVLLDSSHLIFSQAFFALQRLKRLDIHEDLWHWVLYLEHNWKTVEDLNKDLVTWVRAKGISEEMWLTALHNKSTWNDLEWAQKLVSAYQLKGTPAIGMKGKYLTSPSIAGTTDQCLKVIRSILLENG